MSWHVGSGTWFCEPDGILLERDARLLQQFVVQGEQHTSEDEISKNDRPDGIKYSVQLSQYERRCRKSHSEGSREGWTEVRRWRSEQMTYQNRQRDKYQHG